MLLSEDARLGYMAGFFDGEGYIGLGGGRNRDLLRISISNTDKAPIQFFADTFGGNIRETHYMKSRRTLYIWTRGGYPALEILEKLLPYLICKKQQALLGIESVGATSIQRFKIGEQLKTLHHR